MFKFLLLIAIAFAAEQAGEVEVFEESSYDDSYFDSEYDSEEETTLTCKEEEGQVLTADGKGCECAQNYFPTNAEGEDLFCETCTADQTYDANAEGAYKCKCTDETKVVENKVCVIKCGQYQVRDGEKCKCDTDKGFSQKSAEGQPLECECVATTHDIVGDKCLPKCGQYQVRDGEECKCDEANGFSKTSADGEPLVCGCVSPKVLNGDKCEAPAAPVESEEDPVTCTEEGQVPNTEETECVCDEANGYKKDATVTDKLVCKKEEETLTCTEEGQELNAEKTACVCKEDYVKDEKVTDKLVCVKDNSSFGVFVAFFVAVIFFLF